MAQRFAKPMGSTGLCFAWGLGQKTKMVALRSCQAMDDDAPSDAHVTEHEEPEEKPTKAAGSKGKAKEGGNHLPIANITRIMKKAIPSHAKISKEAKDCVQESLSEFLLFITSEYVRVLTELRFWFSSTPHFQFSHRIPQHDGIISISLDHGKNAAPEKFLVSASCQR
jgi:hypothetical protein